MEVEKNNMIDRYIDISLKKNLTFFNIGVCVVSKFVKKY